MTTYKAPLRDMRFSMEDVLDYERHYGSLPGCEEVNPDLVNVILEEASKFSEEIVAPLNAVGDQEGCQMTKEGDVKTPSGFNEVLLEGDEVVFKTAIADVIRARGVGKVAKLAGVNRATVFKTLKPDTRTAFTTYHSLLTACGIHFATRPIKARSRSARK